MYTNNIYKLFIIVSFLTIQYFLYGCGCKCIDKDNEFTSDEKGWLTENSFADSIKFTNDFNQTIYHYVFKSENTVIPECGNGPRLFSKCCICPEDYDLYGEFNEFYNRNSLSGKNVIFSLNMSRDNGETFKVNYAFRGQPFTSFDYNLDTLTVKNVKYYNVYCYNLMGNPFNIYQLYYSKSKGVLQYIYNDTIWYRQP